MLQVHWGIDLHRQLFLVCNLLVNNLKSRELLKNGTDVAIVIVHEDRSHEQFPEFLIFKVPLDSDIVQ